jgi:hypothetical protein
MQKFLIAFGDVADAFHLLDAHYLKVLRESSPCILWKSDQNVAFFVVAIVFRDLLDNNFLCLKVPRQQISIRHDPLQSGLLEKTERKIGHTSSGSSVGEGIVGNVIVAMTWMVGQRQ